jgi:hypothetical protein
LGGLRRRDGSRLSFSDYGGSMKASSAIAISLLALGIASYAQMAQADTADANCEVRKDGEKMKGKSGPCTFGQRQGYIDIDLKNGDTFSLKPTGSANHYKDQKGIKVVRTHAGGNTQEFKWEGGKKLIVTFNSSAYGHDDSGYGNGNSGNGDYSINRMSNGGFEVVWTKHGCIATFNARGEAMHYSNGCNDNQISRSQDIARQQR